MIKFLSAFLIMIGLSNQACDKGCLKCNSKNECVFCDVSSSYYLNSTNCTVSTSTNCLTLNLNGDCSQCQASYYLDSSTKRCVEIDKTKAVANCTHYGVGPACVRCAKNLYMNNGNCSVVANPVDNCEIYINDGKCGMCSDGYIFNSTRNGCFPVPSSSNNCAAFSFLDCKACASGYVPNQNLYFFNYLSSSSLLFTDIRSSITNTNSNDWTPLNRCQKIQDPNCLTANAFNTCSKCKTGFYVRPDGTCQANPSNGIEACQIYSSLTKCASCQTGFYLETPFKCSPIIGDKLIANCTSYDSSASTVRCAQCISAKYLSGNACTSDRVDSLNITNCKTFDPKADSCSTCNDGFLLTNDAKKCLATVKNCNQYSNSDSSSTALNCKKCSDTYYLDTSNSGTSCVAGTIEGCLVYGSSTTCLACNNNAYYLDNSKCTKHVKVDNCVVYSGINFNKCTTCAAGYYPFDLVNTCSPITVIMNCAQYSDANTCSACSSGYFLQSNACVSISGTFPNCEYAPNGATNCARCSKGYALKNLDNDKTCVPLHNYILDQCDSPATNVVLKPNNFVDYNSCLVCRENSIAFDLNGLFACVSSSLLNTRGISVPVTDCKQYSNDASPVCLQCSGFLSIPSSGPRVCSTSCNPTTNTNVKDNLDGNINTCASNSADGLFALSGCSSAIKVYENNLTLKCMKFASNKAYVPLTAAASNNPSYWRDIDDSTVPRPDGAFLYFGYPVFNSANTDTDSHQNEGDSNKSCELYWKTGSVLYCYRCKWGYASKHYIPSGESALKTRCLLINGCDTSISYTGFSAQLNQILSCHACTSSQFVTVIVGTVADNTDFNVSSLVQNKQTIQCLPLETNPTFDTSESKPKLVDGCLIYGWLFTTTNPASPVAPTFARGCLACKSGYKLSGNFGTCSPIANCDLNKKFMVNRCSVCTQTSTSGSVELRAFRNYLAQECLLVNTDNCLFADSTADANNKYTCTTCKPGFWLNYDKICEKLTLPQCSDASGSTNIFSLPNTSSLTSIITYYAVKYLSKAPSVTGCDTCASTFTGIRMNLGERQCVPSPYVQANNYRPSPIQYISNCLRYNNFLNLALNPVVTCNACKSGKIPTKSGSKCVDPPIYCAVASDSDNTKCDTCSSSHIAISGTCVLKNVVNCIEYVTTPSIVEPLCMACLDGYVLSFNKKACYKGNVFGCKSYDMDSPWVCDTCSDGYYKLSVANSKTYCLKINEGNYCQSFSTSLSNGLQGGYYKCNACIATNGTAYFVANYDNTNKTLPQSICLSLIAVDKCVSYGTGEATIAESTLSCSACASGYYLEEGKNACISRTVLPSGCLTYYVNRDRCLSCNATTFKNDAETDCLKFPVGVYRCATYSNDTNCTSCYPPAYLKDNACPLSTVISKCAAYSANYTCTACENGYYLFNSTYCGIPVASNCYTYSSNITCEKCDPNNSNKGLKTDDAGVTNCVDKNVPDCDLSTDQYPFTCIRCKKEFYVGSDGNCTAVNTTISKCLVYDGVNTCAQCEQSTVLSGDKLTCNDTFFNASNDANCIDSRLLNSPICSKCKAGYVFVNGTCTTCSNNTYQSGCFSCDPSNSVNCLACRPGYYQNSNGACVSLIVSPSNTTKPNTSQSIVPIMSCLLYLIALLFVVILY